ncbi:MAG: GNAT family N-acetyltransferase [Chitinophagales bacterium]
MEQIEWRVKKFEELTRLELYDMMNLRQVVFVVEQDCPYIDADYKDLKSWHIMGYIDGKLKLYTRLVFPSISYKEPSIGRVVSCPSIRRQGYGVPLMQKSVEIHDEKYPNQGCRISAQTYLIPYYSTFGFEVCSEEYLEDNLPHHEMIRK